MIPYLPLVSSITSSVATPATESVNGLNSGSGSDPTNGILTEASDFLTTESGDFIVLEQES